jgi:hypothetical protein
MTNDLTVKQAVEELKAMKKHIEPYMSVVGVTAYDMAIQALEQTDVLDKIRAEIANHCGLLKQNHCRYCSYCNSVMGVREIIEIIDKYKAESEE